MKSAIVISAGQPDLGSMSEAYDGIGSTHLQSPKRLVVEGDWGWFAIAIDDKIEGEFSDTERAKIAQSLPEAVYAQLEYSNSFAADLAIRLMPVLPNTLIDNDHGMLRQIGEVRDLIRKGMEWQTTSS